MYININDRNYIIDTVIFENKPKWGNSMFLKKKREFSLREIIEESKKQLIQAEQGHFDFSYEVNSQHDELRELIENLNKVNELRKTYESRLRQKIHNLVSINKVGFWERCLSI